jgi:hypothetical protein
MNLVQRAYEDNNIAYVRELLDKQIPQNAEATDFQHFEWHYWYRLSHLERLTIQVRMRGFDCVAWSGDGRKIVSGNRPYR